MDNKELKECLNLKGKFAQARFSEKKELVILRHRLSLELSQARDKVATKRHNERIEILKKRMF